MGPINALGQKTQHRTGYHRIQQLMGKGADDAAWVSALVWQPPWVIAVGSPLGISVVVQPLVPCRMGGQHARHHDPAGTDHRKQLRRGILKPCCAL